ncbi:MAG: MATE family efflux transporter [Bacteroidia bacterium]|nr:MATE family efflux transporter [Bacteroidia bacterium]
MLSQLGHVMMGVTDSIMVGHVGPTSLAAVSLANVVFNVLLLFGIGVSYAITPLVASAHGEGKDNEIAAVVRHGLVINVVNGIVLAVAVWVGKNFLHYIGQPEPVVNLAIPYLSIVATSMIPVLIFQTLRQFTEGLTLTRVAMVVILVSNVVNIALNYLLIFGHMGFPALGLEGAGWATFFSRIIMCVAIILYVNKSVQFARYPALLAIGNYSKALFNKMLHIGIPAGLQFIFEVVAFDFSAIMMGWLGTKTLAAHQIAINLATISYMTTSGLAAAATIRVGYFLGRRDGVNLRQSAFTLLGMAMTIMLAWALLFILGRHMLPHLYIGDADVIAIASPLLIIAGLFQLSDGAQVVCIGALRGLQDVKIPSLFIFIAYWVIGLPLGYWLGFKVGLGAQGIWLGLLTGLSITASVMFTRFVWLSKKQAAKTTGATVIP